MKRLFQLILLFCALSFTLVAQKNALPPPNPVRLVVDNANILNEAEKDQLERKLVALDDSTSNQICVVTVASLNDREIEDVATETFRSWGIGNKKTNNGVLLLISVNDHKVRIEVGYGLEGAIPDIICGDIIEHDIKPAFRESKYYDGIDKAVSDLSKAAAGEYHIRSAAKKSGKGGVGFAIPLIILVIIFISLLSKGGGSGMGKAIIIGSLLNSLGNSGRDGGGWGDSGGGGFGGFGGGSSGGGGASGSW